MATNQRRPGGREIVVTRAIPFRWSAEYRSVLGSQFIGVRAPWESSGFWRRGVAIQIKSCRLSVGRPGLLKVGHYGVASGDLQPSGFDRIFRRISLWDCACFLQCHGL